MSRSDLTKVIVEGKIRTQKLEIAGIPAIIWGENSPKIFIAVHGNMSSKADQVIVIFAEKLTQLGYQVLSYQSRRGYTLTISKNI